MGVKKYKIFEKDWYDMKGKKDDPYNEEKWEDEDEKPKGLVAPGEVQLRKEEKKIIKVHDDALDNFVRRIYNIRNQHGQYYSFVEVQECGNDSSHEFRVDGQISDYHLPNANQLRQGNMPRYYSNSLILNMLCADGYIEPGDYLISVSW